MRSQWAQPFLPHTPGLWLHSQPSGHGAQCLIPISQEMVSGLVLTVCFQMGQSFKKSFKALLESKAYSVLEVTG